MKILYVATERRDAQRAVTPLRSIAPGVTVSWAGDLPGAAGWVESNRDVRGVIVEADVDGQSCASFVAKVRALGVAVPIVVVTPAQSGPPLAALTAGADDYIANDATLLSDLPGLLTAAIQRTPTAARTQPPLDPERIYREMLEAKLAAAEEARRGAEQRLESEKAAIFQRVAERLAHYDRGLAHAAAARAALEQKIAEAASAIDQADERLRLEQTGSAERLARCEADFTARIHELTARCEILARRETDLSEVVTGLTASRDTLVRQLSDAAASRLEAEQRHASEVSALTQELADRQAQHDSERTARQVRHETELANLETQHDAELATRRTEHQTELAHAVAVRHELARELRDTTIALERARQDHAAAAAAVDRLTTRESELSAAVAELTTTVSSFVIRLADADAALDGARRQATLDRQSAAERQAIVEDRLAREIASRESLERQLADAEAARGRADRHHASELAAAAEQLAQQSAHFESELANAAARLTDAQSASQRAEQHHASQLADAADRLARETAARENVERELAEAEAARRRAEQDHALQLADAAERLAERSAYFAAELADAAAARDALAEALRETTATLERTEQNLAVEAASVARLTQREAALEQLVAERETRLKEHAAANLAAQRAAKDALAQLQNQLNASESRNRRRLETSPHGFFGCDRDGRVQHVNRALVRLLAYRTADELKTIDFGSRVFESIDDFQALIEQCLATRRPESTETQWKRKDGGRLVVRLLAVPVASDSVEIVAEDLTPLRGVENRLRQAERMEAVGRLASDIAATCDNLLRDITHDCEQWLSAVANDAALRYQGELLLSDVTRAATFLRQLTVYGKQQAGAAEPVSVNHLLRDLAPVLKRVAGGAVEFVLPKAWPNVKVDVDAERLERILINVAGYARQRMPFGGQVKIDVASVLVDRKFVAKYPNVRPGPHALITVSEMKVHSDVLTNANGDHGDNGSTGTQHTHAVDFGPLLALIRNSGGHLWMTAEPPGKMVLKIHLPKPASNELPEAAIAVPRSDRRRAMARWFGH